MGDDEDESQTALTRRSKVHGADVVHYAEQVHIHYEATFHNTGSGPQNVINGGQNGTINNDQRHNSPNFYYPAVPSYPAYSPMQRPQMFSARNRETHLRAIGFSAETSFGAFTTSESQQEGPITQSYIEPIPESLLDYLNEGSDLSGGINLHGEALKSKSIFKLNALNSGRCYEERLQNADLGTRFTGRVICSTSYGFHIIIGCEEGLWVLSSDHTTEMRKLLDLRNITQCAVLEEFDVVLVLANKVLHVYSLKMLSSPIEETSNSESPSWELETGITLFGVGKSREKVLLVYARRRLLASIKFSQSIDIYILEPVKSQDNLTQSSTNDTKPVQFKSWTRPGCPPPTGQSFQRFDTVAGPVCDIAFFEDKLTILCPLQVILYSERFGLNSTIDLQQRRPTTTAGGFGSLWSLISTSPIPFNIFDTGSRYLVCYPEFGRYIAKYTGDTEDVSWWGVYEAAALHGHHILLFGSTGIEVRDLKSGKFEETVPAEGEAQIHVAATSLRFRDGSSVSCRVTDIYELCRT
ncbi:hypothetical protein BDN72DRAFT_962535 [Pluteus cervinus]|uniref:Uncharacterized protein n=1 Tax=Pluteus cervinus TaxID=181527 RepID=A0ACD3AI70_9AGAR|nr:hypothetical protein BDN72DRAFT_962535 [Pluteus cervinus]